MHGTATPDELDLALINALQLDPRAPWSRLAGPLGVDPATLSRRWARLRESGNAWVTCCPGASQAEYGAFALVQVACAPGACEEVAGRLARDVHALSVEIVTGTYDLLVTVATPNLSMMGRYVLNRLGRMPGVTATRTHLAQRIHREASRWRMDALDQHQQRNLRRSGKDRTAPGPASVEERRLVTTLAADGRLSCARLGELLDRPESTVRRLLTATLGSGRAVVRCETAHLPAGWRVTATLWLTVPPAELESTADGLAATRETRLVCSTAGEANLLAQIWLHGLSDFSRYEAQLARRFPAARVLDRCTTFTWVKRMGRLLDAEGRRVEYVAMEPGRPVPVEG
ncbi:Lrp/AsnC family transcriptional regulator [Streptomyces altiplanensis]